MKQLFILFALLLVAPMITACSKVPAGHVGVRVNLLGGAKGVDTEVLGPGRYWVGWNQDLYLFPTFTQNYTWGRYRDKDESISFQTVEGLSVDADIGISYHIEQEKVSQVFQKYRKGVDEITDVYLRNLVRNALVTQASTQPIESIYGNGKAKLMAAVQQEVDSQVRPIGIIVENINWVGNLRLPDSVTLSINNKILATQQAQQRENEVATAKAQADIEAAKAEGTARALRINAQAEADANHLVSQSITPELIQLEALKHWNGVLPTVTGGNGVPFINVPTGK
jgi:regulator of protease activity HflC (stomatin/prohibitin superfamily)